MREHFCFQLFLVSLSSLVLFTSVCSQSKEDDYEYDDDSICSKANDFEEQNCKSYVDEVFDNNPSYQDLKSANLIDLFGYDVEEYNITTDDGYILTVQRIPHRNRDDYPRSNDSNSKIPVFIQHGLFSSSATWFWQPKHRALVFMLADAGYDVWIGNARGTSYSSGHVNLTTHNLKYWDFTSHEIGKYDVPATINYITNKTGQNSIYYICHSIGCHQFFVGMILNPDLNEKIRTFFGMAPAVYKGNSTNKIFKATKFTLSDYYAYRTANVITGGRYINKIFENYIGKLVSFCENTLVNCGLCSQINLVMNDFDKCQTNFKTLPGFIAHHPETTALKVYSHAMQDFRDGSFREYNYGWENIIRYGQHSPPDYDWSKVNLPVVLYWGLKDDGVTGKDVAKLVQALGPNVKESNQVKYKKWTHLDFVIGNDADKFVYKPIIEIMNDQTYG